MQLHHPVAGSDERRAILGGLRPAIQGDLGQKLIFVVDALSVSRDFAFVIATPRGPSGAMIDYSKTRYAQELRDGVLDGGNNAQVIALLRYRNGVWKVLTFVIGPTDVAYADWWSRFNAPKSIFPYTQ
jgi:hypothetical protein